MSISLNKATLIGFLGKDPEMRQNNQGETIATFSLATSQSWTDKTTGEVKNSVEWHNVVVFNRLADLVGSYLSKGKKVYIEGQLKTRKWTDKNGQDRHTTEIVINNFAGKIIFLDSLNKGGQTQVQYQYEQTPVQYQPIDPQTFSDGEDTVPF